MECTRSNKLKEEYRNDEDLDEDSRKIAIRLVEEYAEMYDLFYTTAETLIFNEHKSEFYSNFSQRRNFLVLKGELEEDEDEIMTEYAFYRDLLELPRTKTRNITPRLASSLYNQFRKADRLTRDIPWEEEKQRAKHKLQDCRVINDFFDPIQQEAKEWNAELSKLLRSGNLINEYSEQEGNLQDHAIVLKKDLQTNMELYRQAMHTQKNLERVKDALFATFASIEPLIGNQK